MNVEGVMTDDLGESGEVSQDCSLVKAYGVPRVLLVAALVAVVDQLSKWMVSSMLVPGERISVIPGFFDITLAHNKGAAFGLFASIDSDVLRFLMLGLATAIALGVLGIVLLKECKGHPLAQASIGAVLGGALGNIADRLRFGAVVDFFDLYIRSAHWPVFNVADSAICVGVVILMVCRPARGAHIQA